jgi:transcriptional regulator with XRE-family HTH domain
MKIQHKELIQVLAEKTNSSFITIYRIFQGSRRPSPELAIKLEKYTSIPKENWIFPAKKGKFLNPYIKEISHGRNLGKN